MPGWGGVRQINQVRGESHVGQPHGRALGVFRENTKDKQVEKANRQNPDTPADIKVFEADDAIFCALLKQQVSD